jgi:hypothetical protein
MGYCVGTFASTPVYVAGNELVDGAADDDDDDDGDDDDDDLDDPHAASVTTAITVSSKIPTPHRLRSATCISSLLYGLSHRSKVTTIMGAVTRSHGP